MPVSSIGSSAVMTLSSKSVFKVGPASLVRAANESSAAAIPMLRINERLHASCLLKRKREIDVSGLAIAAVVMITPAGSSQRSSTIPETKAAER